MPPSDVKGRRGVIGERRENCFEQLSLLSPKKHLQIGNLLPSKIKGS